MNIINEKTLATLRLDKIHLSIIIVAQSAKLASLLRIVKLKMPEKQLFNQKSFYISKVGKNFGG